MISDDFLNEIKKQFAAHFAFTLKRGDIPPDKQDELLEIREVFVSPYDGATVHDFTILPIQDSYPHPHAVPATYVCGQIEHLVEQFIPMIAVTETASSLISTMSGQAQSTNILEIELRRKVVPNHILEEKISFPIHPTDEASKISQDIVNAIKEKMDKMAMNEMNILTSLGLHHTHDVSFPRLPTSKNPKNGNPYRHLNQCVVS